MHACRLHGSDRWMCACAYAEGTVLPSSTLLGLHTLNTQATCPFHWLHCCADRLPCHAGEAKSSEAAAGGLGDDVLEGFARDLQRFTSHNSFEVCRLN